MIVVGYDLGWLRSYSIQIKCPLHVNNSAIRSGIVLIVASGARNLCEKAVQLHIYSSSCHVLMRAMNQSFSASVCL